MGNDGEEGVKGIHLSIDIFPHPSVVLKYCIHVFKHSTG